MRDKDAERFMKSIDMIDREIEKLRIKHEALEKSLLPAAIRYDRDKVQTSPNADHMADVCASLSAIDNELKALYARRAKQVEVIFVTLDKLEDDRQRIILLRHYIRKERMERIADDLGYELSWTYRLLRTGLRALAALL